MLLESTDPDFGTDQELLPSAKIEGNTITIQNVRDFKYRTKFEYARDYKTGVYDLDKIKSVQLGIIHFTKNQAICHFLTVFNFENDAVVFSVEPWSQKQKYAVWKAFARQYKLVYVIGTPSDVIDLREKYRTNEHVELETVRLQKDQMQQLFLEFCRRANKLNEHPEYFHGFFNNCTNNAISHLNKVLAPKIPWTYHYIKPGYLHKLLAQRGQLVK